MKVELSYIEPLMNKYFLLFPIMFFVLNPTAIAGSKGKIGWVEMGPNYGQKVFIKIIGTNTQHSCHEAGNYNYVLDNTGNAHAATVSAILAAKAANQTVSVSGYGNCDLYGGVETLRWFRVED